MHNTPKPAQKDNINSPSPKWRKKMTTPFLLAFKTTSSSITRNIPKSEGEDTPNSPSQKMKDKGWLPISFGF